MPGSPGSVSLPVGSIPDEHLAVVAIRMEAADRIAAAFGPGAGSAVRGATMAALAELVGSRGTVVRATPDHVAILVDSSVADLDDLVKALSRRLAATIDVGDVSYFVQTHIGVALPDDVPPGTDATGTHRADDLMQAAIAAVHSAFTRGAHLAYASEVSITNLQREVELAAELATAVGEAFTLHYQPIVTVDGLETVGYESLLRWTVDNRVRLPGTFLDAAEETSLIVPIGRWGVGEAIRQLAVWQTESGNPALFMSVNFSSQQLFDRDLAAHISATLAQHSVDGATLWIEVTERDMITADSPASATIHELAALGCVICVDDLGTGYAALRYMVDHPISVAKIDRSLVADMGDDPTKRSIVETVCRLSDELGIVSVAEGVEDRSQVPLLKQVGFTHAQGYLFGRPEPAPSITPPATRV
ncbi:EAL domain-containing protein [Williamsia sp. MIQD14]|uniref:EAL domain-containing protein n=1 Tax=Williamsia sp. MIQD14 TaxID=3425703 RepID=UPI003DA04177